MCSARGPSEGEALLPITRGDPGPVDIEGGRGAGVTETIGDGTNVDSRAQQLGSDEVSQIVKAHATYVSLPAQTFPSAAYQFRSPWLPSLAVVREDQVLRHDASTDGAGDLMRAQEVTSERANGVVGERYKAYSSGFGGLEGDARVLGGGDGSFDANGGIIEVDIRPAKCTDLASSSARCDCNLEPGGQTRVSGCGCCQQVPDHGDGGRVDDRTRNFRPGRN